VTDDQRHMRTALRLSERGLGQVAPNPSVGAVIVKDGLVIGWGITQPGGRPHAETQALAMAGDAARGAEIYVTLEPCSHHGKTPPCAEALIAAGVRRVIVALGDPDPRVSGRGIEMLRAAGIEVTQNVLRDEAAFLQAGFLKKVTDGRPIFTLKLAIGSDGKIPTQWTTSQTARDYVHLQRARHDAVMTGIGTVLGDDPKLTCRLPGMKNAPYPRLVLDSMLRMSPHAQILAERGPVWLFTRHDHDPAKAAVLRQAGAEIIPVDGKGTGLDLEGIARLLAEKGLTRILVEAGPILAEAMLQAGLVDRYDLITAAQPAGKGLDINPVLLPQHGFARFSARKLGRDTLERFALAV
jgi:diaminohydroxyphosphoribosylaminopyrimidine deaminase/5-amino-6-(5-phosphoribosylamino)uracil reductase